MNTDKEKKHKSFGDAVTYAYLRKVKKWMFCPACQTAKMTIDKKSEMWTCSSCGYTLSADEFEDDYVFWFCDECGSYLNSQEGFDRKSTRHICRDCGYENDTTLESVKGICSDCGKVLPDAESILCEGCKKARKEKATAWLATAGKVAGAVAAVAGAIYVAAQSLGEDEDDDSVNKRWLKSASEEELRARKARISAETDWQSGSILDGDFDAEVEALDAIDEEINRRAWDQYNSEDHSNESYGVHREHGWYLPNDD